MESTKAKKAPILKRFKNWITRCMTSLRPNTDRRQESTSSQTSPSEVTTLESSEVSSCSSEESVPSEPGSLHNRSLMSCLQTSSSRAQREISKQAVTSKIPCSIAHTLAFTDNLVGPTQNLIQGGFVHVEDRGSVILISILPVENGRWSSSCLNQTRISELLSTNKTDSSASQDKHSGSSPRLSDVLPVEENMCRICQSSEVSPGDQLLSPCNCSGSMKFVHFSCLKKWLQIRIESGSLLCQAKVCELCKGNLMLDPDTFDWVAFYLEHRQQEADDQEEADHLMRSTIGRFITNLHQHNHTGGTTASALLVIVERIHRPQQPSDS